MKVEKMEEAKVRSQVYFARLVESTQPNPFSLSLLSRGLRSRGKDSELSNDVNA